MLVIFKADSFEVIPVIRFLVHSHSSDVFCGRRRKQRCHSELAVVPCPTSPWLPGALTVTTGMWWQEEKGLRTEPQLIAAQRPSPSLPVLHLLVKHHPLVLPLCGRPPQPRGSDGLCAVLASALTSRSFPLSWPTVLRAECRLRCHKYFCTNSNISFPFSLCGHLHWWLRSYRG